MGSNFLRPIVTPEGANLDIVAVHGLNPLSKENHAYDTWTANGKSWLKDFLPEELPYARILIFGYNANAVFDNSTAGVSENAGSLLNWLKLRRDDCQTRPIIFIAHSLGGIIVKKALIDAQANVGYQSLDEATLGIVFFATPHNGSDHAKLGNIAANIAKTLLRSPPSSLIESLKKNSFFADELRKQFRQKLMHYWILSFYETRPSGALGVIVEEKSGVLGLPGPHEISVALNSNHSDICRFSSKEDDAYFQVSKNIVMLAKQDPKRSSPGKESTMPQGGTGKAKESKRLNTMPTDNANSPFIGRKKILEELRDSLQFKNGEHARAALWGLGGSGKTRIARAFARQLRMDLPETHVFWVYAATGARVRQSYAEIAAVANLQVPQDPRATGYRTGLQDPGDTDSARQPQTDVVQLVNSWLQSDESGHWLIIFDSADSHSSLIKAFASDQDLSGVSTSRKKSLAHMLPRSSTGAILVTTRNKQLALDLTDTLLDVPLMDDVEAEKLVNDKLKHLNPKPIEVHSLVVLLGYLPLALVQAAAYVRTTTITIRKYIQLYNKDKGTQMRLLETNFTDIERDQNAENAVLKTWILSFEQIKLEDPQAANLLSIMSFLDAQTIPESLLRVIIPRTLDPVKLLATLKAFALVTSSEDDETYDMHRMVQSSMQRWLETRQKSPSWADRALGMLETAYKRLMCGTWNEKFDEYYPHTIAALAVKSGPTLLSRRSRAFLWQVAGAILCSHSQFVEAHEKYLEAIKLWTDLLGHANLVTLTAVMEAGENLHILAGQDELYLQEAEELLLRASNGLETVAGPQAISTIDAKVNLAEVYTASEEWTKAKDILTAILRQSEDIPGGQEELIKVIVAAKHSMAHLYLLEGNYQAAETLQLEVLLFRERVFTRNNTDTQAAIIGLASIYSELGQLDKAKNLFEEVLSTNRRLRGEKHPIAFLTMQPLAKVYRKLERYEESLGLLEELLIIMQEGLDRDDPEYISVIEDIAISFRWLYRFDKEIKLREQALAMRRQRKGFDHIKTLNSAVDTAECYRRLQRYDEALELLKEVVPRGKKVLGDEHPETLRSMFELALTHIKMDQVDVGLSLCQEVFLLRQRILGDDHPDTREVRMVLDDGYASNTG